MRKKLLLTAICALSIVMATAQNRTNPPDFDTFQQKFSNSLTFRIVLRHPKLFLKKGLDLLLPLG